MQKAKSRIHFFSFLAQRNWEWRIFFSRSATRKKKLYGWSSSQHWHHHCSDGGDIKLLEILREPSDLRTEALKKWRRQNWHLARERRKKGLSNSNFWILFLGEDSCPTQHCSSYFRERVGFFLAQYLRFDWSFSCVRYCAFSVPTEIVMHQSRWFCDDRYNAIRHLVYHHNHLR